MGEGEQDKGRIKRILFGIEIAFVVGLLLIGSMAILWIKAEAYLCLANPIKYEVDNIASRTGNLITCACWQNVSNQLPLIVSSESTYNYYHTNFTNMSIP